MELYNAHDMPLSSDPNLRIVQEKILRGEQLNMREKLAAGRDHTIKKLSSYELKPDHCYRAINEKMLEIYLNAGYIIGTGVDDEYQEFVEDGKTFNNNKGVDWYLGGVSLRYGDIILECPADKEYFVPSYDNGTHLSYDPNVRFLKSSGAKKPIPMTMITNIFYIEKTKQQDLNQDDINDKNIIGKTR